MNVKRYLACLVIYTISTISLFDFQNKKKELHPDMELSLRLLDETWHLLDEYAETVWTGWNSYKDIPVFFGSPETEDVFVNPDEVLPDGFKLYSKKIQGKLVYYRYPSSVIRARGGVNLRIDGKRYRLCRMAVKSSSYDESHIGYYQRILNTMVLPEYITLLNKSCENFISVIAHESFHIYQLRNREFPREEQKITDFFDLNQASLCLMEGHILKDGWKTGSREEVLELAKQFLAVRKNRRKNLKESNVFWEHESEWSEGSALYVQMKLLFLASENKYKSRILKASEKHFYDFQLAHDLKLKIDDMLIHTAQYAYDPLQRFYYFGMAQGFMLDRLCGNDWKREFFQENIHFDSLLEKYTGFRDEDESVYLNKVKEKYDYEALRIRLKEKVEKEKAYVENILNGQGKKYKIDFTSKIPRNKRRGMSSVRKSRLPYISIPDGMIYKNGFEEFRYGNAQIETVETPFYAPQDKYYFFIWNDTKNPDYIQDYTLTYEKKVGDIYTNVVLKTWGFEFSAKKAEIVDRGIEVEIFSLE